MAEIETDGDWFVRKDSANTAAIIRQIATPITTTGILDHIVLLPVSAETASIYVQTIQHVSTPSYTIFRGSRFDPSSKMTTQGHLSLIHI